MERVRQCLAKDKHLAMARIRSFAFRSGLAIPSALKSKLSARPIKNRTLPLLRPTIHRAAEADVQAAMRPRQQEEQPKRQYVGHAGVACRYRRQQ